MASRIRKKKARTRNRMGEMIAGNGRVWSSARRLVDRVRRWLVESEVPAVVFVPVSSRGQDTWFSATGPGFDSPYRYHFTHKSALDNRPARSRGFFGTIPALMTAGLVLFVLALVLRSATPNRHVRGRLTSCAVAFAAYGLIALARASGSVSTYLQGQLATVQPLFLMFGVVGGIVALIINPWRDDRVPDRF